MNFKRGLIIFLFVVAIVLAGIIVKNSNHTNKKINKNISSNNEPTNINQVDTAHEEERKKYTQVLRVYNAAEYIDKSTIVDFEKEYKVRVEYSEFESNEKMYDDVVANPNNYDVLVPSDYTIDRLIKEDRLAKIDKTKVTNISNVATEYLSPEYDKNNDYVVPYMTGTLGVLYNTKKVSSEIDSWTALFDSKYRGKILMWDSERDCLGATLKMLGYSMNSNSQNELEEVQAKLVSQRSMVQYGEEEIRDMMIAGEGIVALMYSGEAKNAINQNQNLKYVIPKEGSNKWVDGFVIMKNTKNLEMAQNFINFMCRPNIAVRNMTQTGYTSAISGAWGEFGNDEVMFPSANELARCEAFLYDSKATQLYDQVWAKVK
ncbi:MAG: spermidine/putrescine ABC transporter substrate-binding protein [Clostridia bacterium]|nr:spermidine/putrescine ABC transporter substrate-binding protein [Clostridia bacterium]